MLPSFLSSARRQPGGVDELIRDGYVQPTWNDLIEPENWVIITSSGKDLLNRGLKDAVDLALESLGAHLPELRRGMWDAAERSSPDASRQAAHSARELLDQVLKTGAPPECSTRKERFIFLMRKYRMTDHASDIDLRILDASWKLVEAEHDRLNKAAACPTNTGQKGRARQRRSGGASSPAPLREMTCGALGGASADWRHGGRSHTSRSQSRRQFV